VHQPYAVNKSDKNDAVVKALANVPSIPLEPYMTTLQDNCQRLLFQLTSINPPGQKSIRLSQSWPKVGEDMAQQTQLSDQLGIKIAGESLLIAKAKTLKTNDQKIAFLFIEVKNAMKWSDRYRAFSTTDGIAKAWDKKAGNSAEINLILCRLLKNRG
jgi:hypothetical protein